MHRGFSLVELSIVLVILGLLTGGILAGQSLIRAAELRSISTDINRYTAATQSFRDKYFALPGDMTNATKFWGTDSAGCPNGGGATGTCDGNGNGQIGGDGASIAQICETQEYWRQLNRAGLIEGNYTPNTAVSCNASLTPGRELPRLRIASGAVTMTNLGTIVSSGSWPGNVFFPGQYGNSFIIGLSNSSVNHLTMGALISPEEAWNIDTKMDDGKPAIGNVRIIYPSYYGTACATTDVASTSEYSLNLTGPRCPLIVRSGF